MATGTASGTTSRAEVDRVVRGLRRRGRRWARWGSRRLLAVGSRVRCPSCGWQGVRFGSSSNPRRTNRICPQCESSERYRAFELWLRRRGPAAPGARLLEVAPISLVEPTAQDLGYRYTSVDLSSRRAKVLGDLSRLPFADGAFDVVVCFHVLEHVDDDAAAMRELGRILSPAGLAVVVVPLDRAAATTFEDPTAPPEDRERLFGQSDHVRIYGRDVLDRLVAAGLDVEEAAWSGLFTAEVSRRAALHGDDDRFWLCRRG